MLSSKDVWQDELEKQANEPKSTDYLQRIVSCLSSKANLMRLALFVVFALLIEVFLWNSYYWSFDQDKFPTQELELPFNQQFQRPAIVVDKENSQLTLPPVKQMVSSIAIEAYGGKFMVRGYILATSQNHAHTPQIVSPFHIASGVNRDLNSAAEEYQRAVIRFDLVEPALQLFIKIDEQTLPIPMVITKITINPEPEFNFSFVRCLLMLLGFYFLYVILFSKLYKHQIVVDSPVYKLLNRGIFSLMIMFACSIMLAYHPHFLSATGFKLVDLGFIPFSTPEGTILQEIPKTQEDLGNVDIYIELTDAILVKKQLNLDIWVDPKLFQLNNMYDPTERTHNGVLYHLDRAFYNGKYYCYFGLAPFVLIYAPIYLLTGLVPSPTLAIFLATIYALIGVHFLSTRLTSLLCDKCNTTLFVVCKIACYFCSHVFFLQTMLTFYLLPYLTCAGSLCLALSCALSLLMRSKKHKELRQEHKQNDKEQSLNTQIANESANSKLQSQEQSRLADGSWSAELASQDSSIIQSLSNIGKKLSNFVTCVKTIWLTILSKVVPSGWDLSKIFSLLMCGIFVVLVVMSRPLSLLFVIVGIGLIYFLYIFKVQESLTAKIVNSLCLIVPVLCGAVVIAAYNYVRFDTIFEFGQLRQLTGDMVAANTPRPNPEYLFTSFVNILFSNPELSSAFPFVGFNPHYVYTGQYTYFVEHIGLLAFPYFWGLLLIPILWKVKRLSSQGLNLVQPDLQNGLALRCIQIILTLFYFVMIFMLFLVIYNAGWVQRYLTDITFLCAISSFLFIMMIDFKWKAQSERIIFLFVIAACFVSCLLIFFASINNGGSSIEASNPRLFLELKALFDPLNFS